MIVLFPWYLAPLTIPANFSLNSLTGFASQPIRMLTASALAAGDILVDAIRLGAIEFDLPSPSVERPVGREPPLWIILPILFSVHINCKSVTSVRLVP